MKILVTGAAGFIGSHVCEELLNKGFEVIGLDNFSDFYSRDIKEKNLAYSLNNSGFSFFELDIRNLESLQIIPEFDAVVHLAAKAGVRPSILNPSAYIDTNITGTENIHQLMRLRGCRKMVFASSSSIYGNSELIPFAETNPDSDPISPYAYTKKSCELLNYTNHYLYNIDVLNLRFFTVYGPRQRPDLAIHKFTKLIESGLEIPVFGNGETSRDYTFIADTVDGVLRSLDYILKNDKVYEIINLGNNHPVKLKDLIRIIGCTLRKEVKIKSLPMQEGDVNITYADISKAKQLLGYNPKTEIEDGLKKFVEWFRKDSPRANS